MIPFLAVFIIIAYGRDVRNFLLDALDLGMTDGTYAFFTTEVSLNAQKDVSRTSNDGRDNDAIEAFKGISILDFRFKVSEPTLINSMQLITISKVPTSTD